MALLAIGASALRCARSGPPEKVPPGGEIWLTEAQIEGARIAIDVVRPRLLSVRLITAGKVAFDESRVAHVFAPLSGRITRVVGQLGQRVRAGDTLAVIESPDLASAWSDLAKARADRVAAEHEFDRQKNLLEHHAAAERDFETAQGNAEKARAEVSRAELRLKTLHVAPGSSATQEFFLRSPIVGEIVGRTATPGLEVQGMLSSANVVQELYTVGELDPIWIWGDLYERDLGKIRDGEQVSIRSVAYPELEIRGSVDWVASSLDPQTHTARLRCAVRNRERLLKPEMYVTLSIEVDRREALALPRTAVIKSGDRQTVYVRDGRTEDGRARFRERGIQLGDRDDGWVSVVSGLSPGEAVVVSGSILLSGAS